MLKKLHNSLDVVLGLKDNKTDLEATTPEKITMYSMYVSISLIALLMTIITK